MKQTASAELHDETAAWCDRAERFAQCAETASDDEFACLALVRQGIFLRRRWDRTGRDAPQRRRLLGLLAAVQNVCQRQLAEMISDGEETHHPDPRRVEHMIRRLAEDDHYLADLLNDQTLPAETVAFALACFRDDLHWLGTLVALLDGSRGVDFTGRVLLEQESIQRALESWDEEEGETPAVSDELRQAASRLRTTTLTRRAESLLSQQRPDDWLGWYRAWQSASQLARRPRGIVADELEQRVDDFRREAADRLTDCLAELDPKQRHHALRHMTDDLADTAGEVLTFLEDLPLAEAVRSLEILAEDAKKCLKVAKRFSDGDSRGLRKRLRARRKAVATELMERRLDWRMEGIFGRGAVAFFERFILILLLLFVIMLAVEVPLANYAERVGPESRDRVIAVCAWIDLGICLIFLTEFFVKWSLARPRRLYFHRNWITGLVPAIPFGFMAYAASYLSVAEAAEGVVLLRALRFLRFGQMARWLRFMRPMIRGARLVAFVMQTSDRLVRQIAPLINRNLILFERAAIEVHQPKYRTALAALRERCHYRTAEMTTALSADARQRLAQSRIEDLTAALSGPRVGLVAPAEEVGRSTTREIPLEQAIVGLLAATPAAVSDRIGRNLTRSIARWCRAFDVIGIRRLPLIRDVVAAGRRPSPYGATAHVANRLGVLLRDMLDRVYWVADFYGTVTAPQLVDSVGGWMIKSTARPARRLLMIGVAFLVITSMTGLLPFEPLRDLTGSLERLIVAPLVILGLLCLLPLFVGIWFRQIAGEASIFFHRVAEAQFITATKRHKRRLAKRHYAIVRRRVIEPERTVAGEGEADATAAEVTETVDLLFRDYLDGAPFNRNDTKTATQLLGNLALISVRENRLQYTRRQRKRLRRLDLANSRVWLRGPYLWFHFVSRSLSQQTAKLVVDYNGHALTLNRATGAAEAEIRRHIAWLARRLKRTPEDLALPAEFQHRREAWANRSLDTRESKEDRRRHGFHGNDFTAIHFLSADPVLEDDVRRRYGDLVADLMHRDRVGNIRRVFRTFPFHHWAKERRTLNPLAMHTRFLAGGRVLLLPFRLAVMAILLACRGLRLLGRFVHDVLNPTVSDRHIDDESDPFAVAVRKIHRMRKPIFLECLRMRAEFDPEYLGVVLPGSPGDQRKTIGMLVEKDLAQIGADGKLQLEFRRMAVQRRKQTQRLRKLLNRFDMENYSAESLRAMTVAYTIDYQGIRSRLAAAKQLHRAFDEVLRDESALGGVRSFFSIRHIWRRCRDGQRIDRLFASPAFARFDRAQQRVCRQLVFRGRGPFVGALRTLTRDGIPADPREEAREVLRAVGADPTPWSRQLVVLRTVQTLSVLDLRTYCELVNELGEYGA